jgi:hypothetical protein
MPYTQKFNIVGFDKRDRVKIVKLFIVKFKRAKMIYLSVYLRNHFFCENNILISAFKNIRSVKICVFMEHYHSHIELVQVGIKQRNDNRAKPHHLYFPPNVELFSI